MALLIEFGTISVAGFFIGFCSRQPFTGILLSPYSLMSPSNQAVLVPLAAMFVGIAIGLAASPTGVYAFGSELVNYWREASVGHNKLAYYIGKSFSLVYRIALGSLHFTALYLLLAYSIVDTQDIYAVTISQMFAVYGLASIVSLIITEIDTATLVAIVLTLIEPVMGGFIRNLKLGIARITYSWWANEAYFSYNVNPYRHLYYVDTAAKIWRYTLGQTGKDIFAVFLIGFIYRVVAFFFMIGLNREKQN